jgi:peptide methionine sulfoxide reductase MsrB
MLIAVYLSDTILKVVKTDEQWKRDLPLINIIFYVKKEQSALFRMNFMITTKGNYFCKRVVKLLLFSSETKFDSAGGLAFSMF